MVCVALGALAVGRFSPHPDAISTLGLLGVALASSAWAVYPATGAAVASGAVFLCLLWAGAARHVPEIGALVVAFWILLGAAVVQRRRRFKRRLRMSQVLDDLGEEQTVKDQAIHLAQQTREGLHKKLARYQQLQTIAEQLSNLMDVGTITKLAVDRAFELVGKSEVCLLFLVEKERQALSLVASRRSETVKSVHTKHGDQFDRYVLRTHRPLLVNDVRRDFRFTTTGTTGRPMGSVIACPLLIHQSAEGILRLDSARPGVYTQDDLRFLDVLLDLVATSVANAKLFARTQQLAMTDGLTNLLLRRPFQEQLGRELLRAERTREPLAVLMLDLDAFKAYNDTYGHTAGDVLLTAVADVLRHAVPPEGASARYGGEEFAVLLPRTSREAARKVAEAIRVTVERGLVRVARSRQVTVTVSIGVATFPDDAQAELELVRAADQRLYEAKRTGKNRVCG